MATIEAPTTPLLEQVEGQLLGQFDLFYGLAFANEARQLMAQAEDRVLGKSMHAELGHATGPFFDQFKKVPQRGVYTRLDLDDYTLTFTDTKFNAAIPLIRDPIERANREFRRDINARFRQELVQAGVDVRYHHAPLGLGTIVPYAGCEHKKILVVDNVAFLGGMNFSDGNFLAEDFMVKITDQEMVETAAWLFNEGPSEDREFVFGDGTQMFVDAGIGGSLILDSDLKILNNAKESFLVTSGFLPDGRFLKALEAAQQRGVKVEVIVGTPDKRGLNPMNWITQRSEGIIKKKNIPLFIYPGQVHAKMFVADGQIGRFGSHNFTDTTQWAGTKELSVQSTDSKLVGNLTRFYDAVREKSQPYSSFPN